MSDNVGYTPGTGATIAADDVGGVLHQRVKVTLGGEGVDGGDVAPGNPLPVMGVGELVEQLSALRMLLQSLVRSVGQAMPDAAGRMLVSIGAATANVPVVIVNGTVTTVQAVTTVGNQTSIGGLSATEHIPALMHIGADSARRNITVAP